MLSFKQKIFLTFILVFLSILGISIPFASRSATDIMQKAMVNRANELITDLQKAKDEEDLIALVKQEKPLLFYRVTLINSDRMVLYDTHTKRLVTGSLIKDIPVSHPEVMQALKEGTGYHEEYSQLLKQEFAYFAKVFYFQGKEYILRISTPLRYVNQVTRDFTIGFILLSTLLLTLFSLLAWMIINHFTKPIQRIIQAIQPYQQGKESKLPLIHIDPNHAKDDFSQLAATLNSLSIKVDQQIQTLIGERQERELLLESLGEGVVAVGNTNEVIYSNTQALRFFDVQTKEEIFSGSLSKIRAFAKSILESARQDQKVQNITIDVQGDRGKKFFNLLAVPLKEEKGAILVLQDQTSQLRLVEMRRDFVANASHELRTPITIIQGFAEALQEPTLTPQMIQDITQKILRNCRRMTTMIKDLLLLADIEHLSPSKFEPVELVPVVMKCKDQLEQIYPGAEIDVSVSPEGYNPVLSAVPSLIERAILNIMDNGLKYSRETPRIEVHLLGTKSEIQIKVKDFGIGIPENELDQIFTRFYRTDIARKKITGSGLGLSIVETIIQKHHGKIEVESQQNIGSTFTLTFAIV